MFYLVGRKVYSIGDTVEFLLKDNQNPRYRGRLAGFSKTGMIIFTNVGVLGENCIWYSVDYKFEIGVYEITEYLNGFTGPLAISTGSGVLRLVSEDNSVIARIGDNVAIKVMGDVGESIYKGVLKGIEENVIALYVKEEKHKCNLLDKIEKSLNLEEGIMYSGNKIGNRLKLLAINRVNCSIRNEVSGEYQKFSIDASQGIC